MYNILFYKAYKSAMRSGNFFGYPTIGGCTPVAWCVLLNLLSISLILERLLSWDSSGTLHPFYKWAFSIITLALVMVYYWNNSHRLIDKYDNMPILQRIPTFLVMLLYFTNSFIFAFLAAVFRNHGWIFK